MDLEKENEEVASLEIIESRQFYVKEVAKTIMEGRNDESRGDSFIFGLSGKWGEGKTHFLKQLEQELKNNNESTEVIWINPWKFGTDKISFLRTFLRSVGNKKRPLTKRISNWFNAVGDFDKLYYDVSVTKIHPGGALAIVLWVAFVITLTFVLPEVIVDKISNLAVVTLVGLPILIPLIGKVITNQRSNRSISTIDQFDTFLEGILDDGKSREIVIYIDDLDRVTPQVARDVLDNLRTFFDKPQISFLVTGDHTVLERHLGRELLPDNKENLQLEEGRRFLKKIFNVYWQLPAPTDGELNKFVQTQISSKDDLNTIIKDEASIENLQAYLKKYFKNNLREVIRFIDMLLFNFRIVDAKIESGAKDVKEITEIKKNPMLFVRVRMIQELCPPLFKKIANNVSVLEKLDRAADREDNVEVDKILSEIELTPDQESFIRDFLPQGELFVQHGSVIVSDPSVFVRLAVDGGLDDKRGPSPEDFIERLSRNEPEQLRKSLLFAGNPKLGKIANAFIKALDETLDIPAKEKMMDTLVSALGDLEEKHPAHSVFVKKIQGVNFDFYRQISPQERSERQPKIWGWLDVSLSGDDKNSTDAYIQKFPYLHEQDLTQLTLDENSKLGSFGSRVVTYWFNGFFAQNQQAALNSLTSFLPFLDKESVTEAIDKEVLTNNIVDNLDLNIKNKTINLLGKELSINKKEIKERVLKKINTMDQAFFSWAEESTSKAGALWSKKDLEMQIVNKMQHEVSNEQEMIQILRFAVNNVTESVEELWEPIRTKHMDMFINSFDQIVSDPSFEALSPPAKVAKLFLKPIVKKITDLGSVPEQMQQLNLLRKEKWIWKKLKEKDAPDRRSFAKITRSEDQQAKATFDDLMTTWKNV